MKAMIFAAGLGTRLRPLTDSTPKALIPVAGTPMLQRVIEKLIQAGVSDIVVNVHHFADQIINFLNEHHNFGANIVVSDERDLLLDTGGGILKASQWLAGNEPIIVHNADILTDFDITAFERQHSISGADASLLVANRVSSRYLYFNSQNSLVGWQNTKSGETKPEGFSPDGHLLQRAFAGVHIISPSIFPLLAEYGKASPAFSIIPFYLSACNSLSIKAYEPQERYMWHDIGSPEKLAAATAALQ